MNLHQMNILLADDDIDDCSFFDRALNELTLSPRLTTVHDGEQLMQYLNSETNVLPDVLFLDINMPRKNGFECLGEIKANKKLKDLPVIIFSTSNSHDKINMLFKSGAHVYIHKPSDFAQLKEVIYHALPIATEKVFSQKGSFQPNSPLKYILNA